MPPGLQKPQTLLFPGKIILLYTWMQYKVDYNGIFVKVCVVDMVRFGRGIKMSIRGHLNNEAQTNLMKF